MEDAEGKEKWLAKSGSSPGGQAVPVEATEVLVAAMAVLSEAMVAVLVEATAGTPDPESLASTSAPPPICLDLNKTKYSFKLL